MKNIFWEKRVWNFKHCQYIYLIDNIVIDHNKQKHPIQAQAVELCQHICLLNIKKTNALA